MNVREAVIAGLTSACRDTLLDMNDQTAAAVARRIGERTRLIAREIESALLPVATVIVVIKYADGKRIRHLYCDTCWKAMSEHPSWSSVLGYQRHETGVKDPHGSVICCQNCI